MDREPTDPSQFNKQLLRGTSVKTMFIKFTDKITSQCSCWIPKLHHLQVPSYFMIILVRSQIHTTHEEAPRWNSIGSTFCLLPPALLGSIHNDMMWYDTIRYDMMIWYDMIWFDTIWYDVMPYDAIWYMWRDVTWHYVTWHVWSYKIIC